MWAVQIRIEKWNESQGLCSVSLPALCLHLRWLGHVSLWGPLESRVFIPLPPWAPRIRYQGFCQKDSKGLETQTDLTEISKQTRSLRDWDLAFHRGGVCCHDTQFPARPAFFTAAQWMFPGGPWSTPRPSTADTQRTEQAAPAPRTCTRSPPRTHTLQHPPPPAAALTTSCCVLSMLLPLHVDCHCPSPCVFQALLATTIRYPHKLLSRLWMAFRLAWNAWRSSWSAPKTTANLTDPNPRGSLLLF